jgi:hypothetical protein
MTIYEISYVSDDAPNGYQHEWFTSQAARLRRIIELRRQHAQETAAADGRRERGEGAPYFGHPTYRVDEIDEDTLTFRGTPRQMVLQALRRLA